MGDVDNIFNDKLNLEEEEIICYWISDPHDCDEVDLSIVV